MSEPLEPVALDRRTALAAAAGACLAMASVRARADTSSAARPVYTKEAEADGMVEIRGIHQGKGSGKARMFRFGGAPTPTNFMIYDLPPGASEGVHVHFMDNRNQEGSFDEYYYIISGQGVMEIDGKPVPVTKGDHVHTPLEVAHGIENTHPTENLRIFLTFIQLGDEVWPSMTQTEKPKRP